MVRRFSNQKTSMDETIEVVKLEKSGGCVDRDEAYMQQVREAQIREYFFGQAKNTLSPHIQVIDFSHLSIYKISESKCSPPLPPFTDISFITSVPLTTKKFSLRTPHIASSRRRTRRRIPASNLRESTTILSNAEFSPGNHAGKCQR